MPTDKNSWGAFERAFEAGYGIETDVRDHDGTLVIAHDMPRGAQHIRFDELLDRYKSFGAPGQLAINIKADGLHAPLFGALETAGIHNAFVFDMAVPDAIGYLAGSTETFTRHSELEPTPPFYDRADGVWMDIFDSDWIVEKDVLAHVGVGKKVALVSPELHGRPHAAAWSAWRGLAERSDVLLCTDYPRNADDYFNRA